MNYAYSCRNLALRSVISFCINIFTNSNEGYGKVKQFFSAIFSDLFPLFMSQMSQHILVFQNISLSLFIVAPVRL